MPMAPPRACRTCGRPGCQDHRRPPRTWQPPNYESTRIRGGRLQQLRERLFQRQPLCVHCERDGRVTPATIRDHIVPLAEGGRDVDDNVQALCVDCHDLKTQAEQQRGVHRLFPTGRFPGR